MSLWSLDGSNKMQFVSKGTYAYDKDSVKVSFISSKLNANTFYVISITAFNDNSPSQRKYNIIWVLQ